MNLLRTGFGAYVKLIRLPFDQAAKLLAARMTPRRRSPRASARGPSS